MSSPKEEADTRRDCMLDVIVKTAYKPTEANRDALRAQIDAKEKYLASLSPKERRDYLDANGMSNVSLAPIPLDTLRSSGYREPKKPPPIDWSHWRLMPQVLLREAVALSVNLNPETLKFDKEGKDFQDRLRVALSHVAVGSLQLVEHYPNNEPVSPVLLAVFATWAVSQNIKIPSELTAMATAPLSKENSNTLAFVTPMVNAGASAPTTHKVKPGQVQSELATSENTEQRRVRWLESYGDGRRGAVQRVYEAERLINPNADRSYIGKQIKKAKEEKANAKNGTAMFSQLVRDGKRTA